MALGGWLGHIPAFCQWGGVRGVGWGGQIGRIKTETIEMDGASVQTGSTPSNNTKPGAGRRGGEREREERGEGKYSKREGAEVKEQGSGIGEVEVLTRRHVTRITLCHVITGHVLCLSGARNAVLDVRKQRKETEEETRIQGERTW